MSDFEGWATIDLDEWEWTDDLVDGYFTCMARMLMGLAEEMEECLYRFHDRPPLEDESLLSNIEALLADLAAVTEDRERWRALAEGGM